MEIQTRFPRRWRNDTHTNAERRKEWIQTQKRTFTNWMNDKLKETSYHIEDVETDLADGVALIKLLEVCSQQNKIGRYRENPRLDIHKRENLDIAFCFMKDVEKIPLVNIGAVDIRHGNLKLILSLLWSIILRYQIADGESKKRNNAKKRLLGWINACLPENSITNFTTDWNDGRNLSAVVDYCKPGLIPNHASLNPSNRIENVTRAMDIAEKELNVPQVLHPEDLAVDNPDELSVMTYVSGFCRPNAAGPNSLMEWINKRIPNCPATNFTTDWSDGQRLGALIDSVSGGEFPEADQPISNDCIRNCQKAMDVAKRLLRIENTTVPEDFADDVLDQLTRMTYLTHFRHAKPTIQSSPSSLSNGNPHALKPYSIKVRMRDSNPPMKEEVLVNHSAAEHRFYKQERKAASFHVYTKHVGEDEKLQYPEKHSSNEPTHESIKVISTVENETYQAKRKSADFYESTMNASDAESSARVLGPESTTRNGNGSKYEQQRVNEAQAFEVPIQTFVSKPQNVLVTQPTPTVNGLYFTEQPYSFQVNTVNAGKDTLTVTSRGTESDFKPNVSITENDNGTLTVMFETTKPDAYMVSIQWGEEDVPGSPFTLHIEGKPRPKKVVCSGPHFEIGSLAPVILNVNAMDAEDHTLEVACVGLEAGVVPTETIEHAFEAEKYDISFVPPIPDIYVMEVKLDGRPVPKSPFIVNILQQCDRAKVLDEDMAVFQKVHQFGEPASFRISTTDAGTGTLNITSRGPANAEVVTVNNEDDTCMCSFMPFMPGRYLINVFWNDKHIKGSPYFLSFASNETVTIPGLEFQNETFKIGLPHKFKLHCAKLGEGDLSIRCFPPTCAKICTTQVPESKSYQCEILPIETGIHHILVYYNDKVVPVRVSFEPRGDASKCHMIERSTEDQQENEKSTTIQCISTEGAGKGELTASVEIASTNEILPISVTQILGDRYNVEFNPAKGARHILTVNYDGQHIVGSPFKLVFGPPDASKCMATGDGLADCVVDKTTMFAVDTDDAGPGELRVSIDGEGETIEPQISALNDTQIEVEYLPTKPGKYNVTVCWGKEEIPDSPFTVDCYHPSDPGLFKVLPNDGSFETFIGTPLEFVVKAAGAPAEGELTVNGQSMQNKNAQGTVIPSGDELTYNGSIDLPEAGKYMVHVKWNGSYVKGSPFKARALTPPKPEKVKAYGPGLQDGFIGQEGDFAVETAEGGSGTLQVKVHGPKGALLVNMRPHPESERIILVRYDPNHVGKCTIDVKWSEIHIPGSPFEVNIWEKIS